MYDLTKIIIKLGYEDINSKECLETVVMRTEGMKVTDLLYINDLNSMPKGTKKEIKKELKSELYDDMYDDDLNISVAEAYNGMDALTKVADFINEKWNDETMVLLYDKDDDDEVFEYLHNRLEHMNGQIYLSDYYDIFVDGRDIEKPIIEIMEDSGLKTSNMLADSSISFIYFLHGLVEKITNK